MSWVRLLVVLWVVVTLIAVGSAAAWFHHALIGAQSLDETKIEIPAGSSARQILADLHLNGLMPSPLAGRIYIRVRADGRNLHYGRYVFTSGSRPIDVLEKILDGHVEMFGVTIVEGSDSEEIAGHFIDLGVGTNQEWQSLRTQTEWIAGLIPGAPSLEGFFFPDTYRFAIGIPADIAARHMVDRFVEVWRAEKPSNDSLWGSPLEVTTLASLVEAETSVPEERGLIAGVFFNRLQRGMLLQCDPTVVYSLKRRGEWKGRLYRIHWEVDDPYNTYRFPGLPPGPINCPGRAALVAAMSPDSTPYLYFVAKPGGGHTFSRTLSEHNRAVARLRASRR